MGIEGPSNKKSSEKKAKTAATTEMQEQQKENPNANADTTSAIGDKNIIGIQGRDGSDTEYSPDDGEAFVR